MNRTAYVLNIFNAVKRIIILVLSILPVFTFAQSDLKEVAKNERKQQMEVKYGNFTSFPIVHQNLLGWSKFNKDNHSKHPEFGILPFNAEYPNYIEVLEKRQVDERYFVNEQSPNQFYVQKAMGALHYKLNENWITIDPRITDIGNGIFEASNQWDPVGFDVNKASTYVKTPQGIVYFNNWKLFGTDNEGTEQLLATANWSNYTAGEDGIYVNNIFPGIDAQMQVFRGSVKTNFIVKKLNYTTYNVLLFKDEFNAGKPSQLKFKGEAANVKHAAAGVSLISDNTRLVEIGEAVAYPQNGTRDQKIMTEYFLEGNKLVISVPVNWIQQYVNKTNVIIDPLVSSSNTLAQGSITGSMYNTSCNFTNSCNNNLSVNTPANATLTDVLWSFTYLANGAQLCYLSDGAITFAVAGCVSPNTAGFYWFCNSNSSGTCAGTNISMWSDVSTCMPAPSCAPQALNFTMKFYRDCWGPTGCDATCIGANSPLIITLQGQTVSFTNTATPFTLSANTVCFGQTISATTAIQYGVPVRTVNWSFNSSGTPSVGSGTNPTISFPSVGTYTVYCIVTDGCSQTATSNQVVTVNPLPTLTVTASPDPICAGQSSTLTVSGANTYTWSGNAGGGTGATATVTPAIGTTIYSVTATSAASCVNTGTVSSTVNPLPTVTAIATPTAVCSGQSSLLTSGGATTYTWSVNAGGVQTNTASVSPVTNDTYTVTGTDINSCTNTATVTINITPSPTLITNVTTATICAGRSDTIGVSGATTYTWSANAGSATTATVSVNPVTTTIYTVTGDNGGACTSIQTVTVNVTPLPSLTVTASPNPICTGQSSTLTVSGAATYTWSANAGSVNTTTVSVSPLSMNTYTVSATQGGCSDSTTITINVVTPPTVSVTATQTIICSGGSTTLTASGAANYTWMPGGSAVNPLTVSPGVTTTYTLVGANGACLDSTTIVINVNPTPTITVNNPVPICSGSSSTLTASGATTFTWMPGSVVSNTVSVSPGSTQTYTVTGDSLTCQSTQTVTVNVTATPTVIVFAPPTVCSGQSVPIIAGGAVTYTWSANAGGGSFNPVIVTPTTNPTIYTVTGADGICQSTATVSIGVITTPTVTVVSPPAICRGDTATLIATFAPVTSSLSWTPGGSINDSVRVSPISTTSYTVYASNGACKDSFSVSVTVNSLPTMTLSPNATQTVCFGNNVNAINFTVLPGTAMIGWTNTNTNIGIGANGTANIPGYAAPTVVTPQVGVITVVPMDMATTCMGAPQTFTITIKPSPTVIAVSPPAICQGQTATLTATFSPNTSNLSWSPGGSINDTVFVSPNSNTSYTVIAENNGCKDSAIVAVTVNPTPTVTLSAITTQTVCYGNNVIGITFATSGGTTEGWTNTNAAIGIAASGSGNIPGYAAPNVTTQQVGVITAIPTSTAGCVGASQTFTITINPSPTISGIPIIDSAFCGMPVGDIKNLTIAGGTLGYTYQWNIGGVPYPGATKDSLINVPAGSYNLNVTDALGCKANSGPIIIGGTPIVTAAFTASTYHGTAPLPVTFTNGSTGAVNYHWSFGNGSSSAAPNPTYTYQQGGTYQVILTASNGNCSDTAMRTIIIDQPIIVTVPNIFSPNGDGINEEFSIITSGVTDLNCEIFNRWGQKVFTISSPTGKWDGKLDNGNSGTEGTYFYTLTAKSYDGKQHNSQGSITLVR